MVLPLNGVDVVCFLTEEVTFGTRVAIAATDALEYLSADLNAVAVVKRDRKGHTGYGSFKGMILGKEDGSIVLECEYKTNVGVTVPEQNVITRNAFGAQAGTPGTSIDYTISEATARSFQLAFHARTEGFYVQLNGCIVNAVSWTAEGDEFFTVRYEIQYARLAFLLGSPATVAGTAGQGTQALTTRNAKKMKVGAGFPVAFGANTNGGAGYTLTGIDYATGVVSFTPVLVGTVTVAQTIIPITPAVVTHQLGPVMGSLESGLTIDGIAMNFIKGELRLDTGRFLLNKEAGTAFATRIGRRERRATMSLTFYALDDNVHLEGEGIINNPIPLIWRCGPNTAGYRLTFTMPRTTGKFNQINVPAVDEEEVGTWTYEATAEVNISGGIVVPDSEISASLT